MIKPILLYIASLQDGVPIPGCTFQLMMPKGQIFTISKDHSVFAIAIAKSDQDYDAITGLPLTNNKESCSIEERIYSVGVMAELNTVEEDEEFDFVTFRLLNRIEFNDSYMDTDGYFYTSDYMYVEDDFDDELPNELKEHAESIFKHLGKNNSYLKKNVNSILVSADPLHVKLNKLADAFINKAENRVQYLTLFDKISQYQLLTTCIQQKLLEKKTRLNTVRPKLNKVKQDLSLEERLQLSKMPDEHKLVLEKELKRMKMLNQGSNEYMLALDYVERTLSLPWGVTNYTPIDLKQLTELLNETHYGLEDVKKTILGHLCVEHLRKGATGTVLCFVGPPGTGKTSIAKQIAKASNRYLYQIAMGGMGDESELRGFKRTYQASHPGRIIYGLKKAESMDPLFLFDEVDKLARYKGDPSSALLEILDPEQNNKFVDRYIELEIDLSKAMFICTANNKEEIPGPLRDRMEFIYFRDYELDERKTILEDYLLPKCISNYCMDEYNFTFNQELIDSLAENTQIRQIEKTVFQILREIATDILVNDNIPSEINLSYLDNLPFFKKDNKDRRPIGF